MLSMAIKGTENQSSRIGVLLYQHAVLIDLVSIVGSEALF